MNAQNNLKLFFAVGSLICLLVVGCNNTSRENSFFVPLMNGGYKANVYHLERELAKQLTYKIDLPYRSKSAYMYYVDFYVNKGWTLCGELDEWHKHTYLDGNKQIVNSERMLSYFLDSTSDRLSLLLTQTDSLRGQEDSGSITQSVSIIQYQNISAQDLVSLLSLDCKIYSQVSK
ncbi:MAG: DUF2812 domain-containing protein [Chromatiales bacterium]|nr:DUF2812 domain-containing protein [Chromatiales bacterium]